MHQRCVVLYLSPFLDFLSCSTAAAGNSSFPRQYRARLMAWLLFTPATSFIVAICYCYCYFASTTPFTPLSAAREMPEVYCITHFQVTCELNVRAAKKRKDVPSARYLAARRLFKSARHHRFTANYFLCRCFVSFSFSPSVFLSIFPPFFLYSTLLPFS